MTLTTRSQQLPDAYQSLIQSENQRLSAHSLMRSVAATGTNIDVKYHRCNWRINPDSSIKAIGGTVTTYFRTTAANVSSISFDFQTNLTATQVRFRGANLPAGNYTEAANVLTINLGTTIAAIGTLDSISITYNGTPPNPSGASVGYVRTTHGASLNYIYTLSQPYEDRDWWPCKADMTDKIDSMDIIVSSPPGFNVASNGKLISEVTLGANNKVTTWSHRYPIPSYLVCLGVANYNKFNDGTVDVNGTAVPIMHWIFPESDNATARGALSRSKAMLDTLCNYVGEYPYKNEKYGHYQFGFGGGMEHATFSGMNVSTFNASTDWSVIAHELGHQWFGNKVTCATWNDIWVNEGLAVYMEILIAEKVPSVGSSGLARRSSVRTSARADSNLSCYLTTVATTNDIFGGSSARYYDKGAMIISQLRALVGDTKFFQALRNYQNDPLLAYKAATTDDVKRHFEAVSGLSLDEYFNDWVYGTGLPRYNINYGTNNRTIFFQLTQLRGAGASPSYFDAPVVLRIGNGAGLDTTVVIFDQEGNVSGAGSRSTLGNTISYTLSFVPTTVTFDPELTTMMNGTVTFLKLLDVKVDKFTGLNRGTYNDLNLVITKTDELRKVTLEKSSDGVNFFVLGDMIPGAAGATTMDYNLRDHSPFNGQTWYRARFRNIDGSTVYSTQISIASPVKSNQLVVAPRPANDYIYVQVPFAGSNEAWKLRLVDMKGALVFETGNRAGGSNSIRIKVSDLQSGVYVLRLDMENGFSVSEKITVAH